MTENKKPVHSIRYGAIQIAVWKNSSDKGLFYTVSMTRRYKDGDAWGDSASFAESDLPMLAKAILDAHSAIQTLPKEPLPVA